MILLTTGETISADAVSFLRPNGARWTRPMVFEELAGNAAASASARIRQPRSVDDRSYRSRRRRHARRGLRAALNVLLVDTGVFVAAADDSDPDHASCVTLLAGTDDELVTTGLVVAEAARSPPLPPDRTDEPACVRVGLASHL
ncbi:MAG: hypothetical protein QM733_05570 [Ilumatobacteraceae bacterium]